MNKCIRQGDVILIPVNKISGEEKKHKELTLAYGEVTGHHHTLYPTQEGSIISEILKDDKRFIKLDVEWLLRHQEHEMLRIPPGTYEIRIEREYDPFEKIMKKVVD